MKEKRENRVEIRLSDFELACLKDRVEKTSFKNNSDFLRASIFLVDIIRQTLKSDNSNISSDKEIYDKIDSFREQRQLERIVRRKNKRHVVVPQVDPKILNQVIRSGNNLNQIAYSVNKAVHYDTKISAYEILEKLLEIENQNKEIIELIKVSKYQNTIKKEEPIEATEEKEEEVSNDSRIY